MNLAKFKSITLFFEQAKSFFLIIPITKLCKYQRINKS